MKEAQRLNKLVEQQSGIIETMEKQYPGITEVKRNASGAIVIDDEVG